MVTEPAADAAGSDPILIKSHEAAGCTDCKSAGDIGHHYYGPGHPMKPARLKLAHHLILAYGLYRKLEIYVRCAAHLCRRESRTRSTFPGRGSRHHGRRFIDIPERPLSAEQNNSSWPRRRTSGNPWSPKRDRPLSCGSVAVFACRSRTWPPPRSLRAFTVTTTWIFFDA